MAKAGPERIIRLREAIALLTETYGSLADRVLRNGLERERVRWVCRILGGGDGWNLPTFKPSRSGKFWRYATEIRWSEDWAQAGYLNGCIIHDIRVLEEDVRALLPTEQTAPLRTTEAKTVKGRQAKRILRVLPKCYPPDGEVSDDTSTKAVRQAVIAELEREAREKGQLKDKNSKLPDPPSWDSVKRVLGRDK
jgi:hypothetical protein